MTNAAVVEAAPVALLSVPPLLRWEAKRLAEQMGADGFRVNVPVAEIAWAREVEVVVDLSGTEDVDSVVEEQIRAELHDGEQIESIAVGDRERREKVVALTTSGKPKTVYVVRGHLRVQRFETLAEAKAWAVAALDEDGTEEGFVIHKETSRASGHPLAVVKKIVASDTVRARATVGRPGRGPARTWVGS